MAAYSKCDITITDKDGGTIELKNQTPEDLKNLEIFVDTVDENVNDHSSRVLNKVTLKTCVDDSTTHVSKQLMDWALEQGNNKVHRTVEIEIKDSKGNPQRYFHLEEMFVEDYKEIYSAEENKTVFELKLIQKAGYREQFKHDIEP